MALETTEWRPFESHCCSEINGISLEDLEDALGGKRIFWMGSVYELGKKRKGAIDALKALSPEKVDDHDIDIPMLEAGLKDAARVGASQFKMPGDHGFGTRIGCARSRRT